MNPNVIILYPSVAMALLTLGLVLAMGARRWRAIARRDVSIRYYRTYSEGNEPEALRRHTRHVQNHFEVPPLFHLAVLGTYATGAASGVAVGLAWFFVASRCVHAFIHLGYNNVTHRFFAYGTGVLSVIALWGNLLWALA